MATLSSAVSAPSNERGSSAAGAVVAREPRGKVDRFAPVIGAQLCRHAGKEGVEILDQVQDVVGVEIAVGLGGGPAAQLGQALADGAAVGPLESGLLVIEVEQE